MYTNNFNAVDGNIPRAVYLYCKNVTISSESLSTVVVDVLLSPIEGCAIEPRGSVLPTVYYQSSTSCMPWLYVANCIVVMAEFSTINAEALLLVMAWLHTDSSISKVNLS